MPSYGDARPAAAADKRPRSPNGRRYREVPPILSVMKAGATPGQRGDAIDRAFLTICFAMGTKYYRGLKLGWCRSTTCQLRGQDFAATCF